MVLADALVVLREERVASPISPADAADMIVGPGPGGRNGREATRFDGTTVAIHDPAATRLVPDHPRAMQGG